MSDKITLNACCHLVGERYFLYRYRIVDVCSVTGFLMIGVKVGP